MTTRVMKVGIAPYADFKARTLAIARGELTPAADEPKVWFPSTESFARVLSAKNRALLATIAETHPDSLEALAAQTGRAPSNLSRTLKTMERFGLVVLHRSERGRGIRPEVPYRRIELELALG
jgi:predicted transcriptional regulator